MKRISFQLLRYTVSLAMLNTLPIISSVGSVQESIDQCSRRASKYFLHSLGQNILSTFDLELHHNGQSNLFGYHR